ncbi:SMP-30/gluconolactonase/LRE family protein [Arthrospiribacter ruber]|uniref:SMP-30/gluconolactonase/LRE family protein n=1 Tax=Arthrospiribacter ruber TaxID=2487934 RepID=A0A951MB83_9BACT|nr:SMP-30/gluconolactonase/LRE family protein [Arthrospiribacter ruber]MBW3468461.1 SMP-30/gluconolactonase/LRE family protein [Arthrospiribacter ruber]
MLKNNLYLLTLAAFLACTPLFAQKNNISKLTAKNAKLEKIGDGFSFTEGPAVHRNGDVYFTDQPNNRIMRWSATRNEISVFMEDAGRSNGMYFDRDSNLITCADEKNQLWSINDKGEVKVLIENYKGNLLNGPNDLWISPYGGMYITDPLYKRDYWERDPEMQQDGEHLYFLSPDKMQFIRVDENLVKPNGVVGTPDGKKLYVADIGDNKTYVYEITEDGYLTNRKLFAEMGSDGMAIDNRGNVYLTGKGVTVFNSRGNQIAHIPIEENWTANVVFGGTDRKTLFITAMGSVYTLQMKTRGVW